MSRWCHHLKGPCEHGCKSSCLVYAAARYRASIAETERMRGMQNVAFIDPADTQRSPTQAEPDKPRWRWDVPPGFYIVLGVMALLGTWVMLAIVWIYIRWPHLWA